MANQISNCPHTGKIRKVLQSLIIKDYDGNLRTHRVIDYFESDGVSRAEDTALGISKELYKPKEQQGTTKNSFINPTTNQFVSEDDENGIPEIEHYRNIPLASLPIQVATIGQLLDYLDVVSTQIADFNNKL